MSGHSKWSTIKHQKGVTDARRGQLFTKLTREITVASQQGGTNPEMNVRLRLAIQKAKESNMPRDNVERAIKRGGHASTSNDSQLQEAIYEGYGPGGAAIMVHAVTDNRNRTVAEIRSTFSRGGGNLGEAGCVAWGFQSKGVIALQTEHPAQAEEIALIAIELGAQDFRQENTYLEIHSGSEQFEQLRHALEQRGVRIDSAEIAMVANTPMPLDQKASEQLLRLLDRLEELDDIQRVYTNADFPSEVLEA